MGSVLGVAHLLLAPAAGITQRQPAAWRVEDRRSIGSIDDPAESLTELGQVRIGLSGQLYLAQPMDRTIRVHDTDGSFVRNIGRQGQGPGEFESLLSIGFTGDTLYAADSRLGRISFFDADGRYLNSVRLVSPAFERAPVRFLATVPQVMTPDGSALVRPFGTVPMTRPGPNPETWQVYLRLGRGGEVLDTLAWETYRPDPRHPPVIIRSDGNQAVAMDPFADRPLYLFATDGSGLVIVEREAAAATGEAEFRVRKIRPSGDVRFSRTSSYRAEPVPQGAVDWAVRDILSQLARRTAASGARPWRPGPQEVERALRTGGHIPPTLAPVIAAVTTQDGCIWLNRGVRTDGMATWVILDGDAETVATLPPPADETVAAALGEILATVRLDSLDVPYLVRYRLHR